MRRARRILLALALSLALLLGLEGLLRALGWHEETEYFQFQRALSGDAASTQHVLDDRRFFALAPNHRESDSHAGRFATGPVALRGRPPEPAPPGIARVAVVGDSCVYGFGLATAETLPERLQARLAELGWDATRVQVLNFGTSGYSTVQIDLVTEEVLARYAPAVVVLYPAAWNDQMPSMWKSDVELLAARRHPGLADRVRATATYAWLAHLAGGAREFELPLPREEVERLWEQGRPPFGCRVPEDAVEGQVRATLARCERAGAAAVVVVPAHPRSTLEKNPRTARDAESVLRAARAAGAEVVDARRVFAAAEPDEERRDRRYFIDFVHPSPPGVDRLAAALAPLVRAGLGAPPERAPGDAPPSIAAVRPDRAPALGDVAIEVALEGLDPRADAPPVVTVGGAPLLDPALRGGGVLSGLLMANAAGAADVLVQTARGCALAPGALTLEPPRIELVPEAGGVVRLVSRPGDRALVLAGTALVEPPLRGPLGARRIADEAVVATARIEADAPAAGVPIALPATRPLFLQALVVPAGEPDDSRAARWSAVTTVP